MPDGALDSQYGSDRNLQDRIDLHSRFSTSPVTFQRWIFEQIDPSHHDLVLEVGCGNGRLYGENLSELPASGSFSLTDSSPGMVRAAKAHLQSVNGQFWFSVADVTHIPFRSGVFDFAIANHMLYHVEKRDQALCELTRVLKPNGCLYAATNGSGHMRELVELSTEFDSSLHWLGHNQRNFGKENGARQLAKWFREVDFRKFPDSLLITDVNALIAYITSISGSVRQILLGRRLEEFRKFLGRRMKQHGAIQVSKDVGLFTAAEPRKDLINSVPNGRQL